MFCAVKPPAFDYSVPDNLSEALGLLRELGDDARPLAGGQSLIPLLSLRLAQPSHLIDLGRVAELASIETDDGHLVLGAMVTERSAERNGEVGRLAPLLAEALPYIGHPAIRSRGTLGGSLSHADPSAELPAVALALDSELVAESEERGRRTIKADDFFTGFFTTALEPDEILTAIRLPVPLPGTGSAIAEVARRHGDFAVVGGLAVVRLAVGQIADVRLVLTGVSDTPMRASTAESVLIGTEPTEEALTEAADEASKNVSPPADLHGTSSYRRHLVRVLMRRTLGVAVQRAKEAA